MEVKERTPNEREIKSGTFRICGDLKDSQRKTTVYFQ